MLKESKIKLNYKLINKFIIIRYLFEFECIDVCPEHNHFPEEVSNVCV